MKEWKATRFSANGLKNALSRDGELKQQPQHYSVSASDDFIYFLPNIKPQSAAVSTISPTTIEHHIGLSVQLDKPLSEMKSVLLEYFAANLPPGVRVRLRDIGDMLELPKRDTSVLQHLSASTQFTVDDIRISGDELAQFAERLSAAATSLLGSSAEALEQKYECIRTIIYRFRGNKYDWHDTYLRELKHLLTVRLGSAVDICTLPAEYSDQKLQQHFHRTLAECEDRKTLLIVYVSSKVLPCKLLALNGEAQA
jgi:hypothetical protein